MDNNDIKNEDTLLKLAADTLTKDDKSNEIPIDREILTACIEYDEKQRRQKKILSVFSKIAVIAFAIFTSFEMFMPETAEAFHKKVFNLIFDDDTGSVALNNESEYQMIGDWSDFHYPQYMPDGFSLIAAEKTEFDSVLLYSNSSNTVSIRVLEYDSETSLTADTDNTEMKKVKIGIEEGYVFIGKNYDGIMLIWKQDDSLMNISTTQDISEDELVKIAENTKYIN